MVEGYGYFGNGSMGDPNGAIVNARIAMDEGRYERINELSLEDARSGISDRMTLPTIQREHETTREYAKGIMSAINAI